MAAYEGAGVLLNPKLLKLATNLDGKQLKVFLIREGQLTQQNKAFAESNHFVFNIIHIEELEWDQA